MQSKGRRHHGHCIVKFVYTLIQFCCDVLVGKNMSFGNCKIYSYVYRRMQVSLVTKRLFSSTLLRSFVNVHEDAIHRN